MVSEVLYLACTRDLPVSFHLMIGCTLMEGPLLPLLPMQTLNLGALLHWCCCHLLGHNQVFWIRHQLFCSFSLECDISWSCILIVPALLLLPFLISFEVTSNTAGWDGLSIQWFCAVILQVAVTSSSGPSIVIIVQGHGYLLNSWDLNSPMGKHGPKGKWPKGESVGPHKKMTRLGFKPRTSILGALTTELYGPEYRVLVSHSYQLWQIAYPTLGMVLSQFFFTEYLWKLLVFSGYYHPFRVFFYLICITRAVHNNGPKGKVWVHTRKWPDWGLNPGPPSYILGALTTELYGPEYRVLVSHSYQLWQIAYPTKTYQRK